MSKRIVAKLSSERPFILEKTHLESICEEDDSAERNELKHGGGFEKA